MDDTLGISVGVGGVLLVIGRMAWERFFSAEGRANDALVDQLSQRIASQEARLVTLEAGLDEERRLRREAEGKFYTMRVHVLRLELELQKHGIEIPKMDDV